MKVTKFYTKNKINYFTFLFHDQSLSVVIENNPFSLTEDDIKIGLRNHDLLLLNITRLLDKSKNLV